MSVKVGKGDPVSPARTRAARSGVLHNQTPAAVTRRNLNRDGAVAGKILKVLVMGGWVCRTLTVAEGTSRERRELVMVE